MCIYIFLRGTYVRSYYRSCMSGGGRGGYRVYQIWDGGGDDGSDNGEGEVVNNINVEGIGKRDGRVRTRDGREEMRSHEAEFYDCVGGGVGYASQVYLVYF